MRSVWILTCLFSCLVGTLHGAAEIPGGRPAARYLEMLERNPAHDIVLDRLWELCLRQGLVAPMLEHLAADGSFAGRMIHGQLLWRAGKLDAARAALEKAAELDPASPLPHQALARLLRHDPQAAAAALEQAARRAQDAETFVALGRAWLDANEPAKAAAAWEQAAALRPGDAVLQSELARLFEQAGLFEQALGRYETLASSADAPQRVEALEGAARALAALGRCQEAAATLAQALGFLGPTNWKRPALVAQLIRLHERTGTLDTLEAAWTAAAAAHPRDAAVCLHLADLYAHLADAARCAQWLGKAAALLPTDSRIALRLARVLAGSNEVAQAAAVLEEILRREPDHSEAFFARCDLLVRQNAVREACNRVERHLQARPGDEALQAQAIDFARRHRLFELHEKLLRTRATSGDEAATLALADFLFSRNRDREARDVLDGLVPQATADPQEQANALGRIAGVLLDHGDLEGARLRLERAVELAPASARLQTQLGDLLVTLGQPDKAVRALEAAWQADPSENADRKIFDLLAATWPGEKPAEEPRHGPGMQRVASYLDALKAELAAAKKNGTATAAAALRLARWLAWSGDADAAIHLCTEALPLEGGAVAGREALARLLMAAGRPHEAVAHLRELLALQPDRRTDLLRRIAGLELEAGRAEAALELFEQLETDQPGDVDALLDTARALQQAGRWYDALDRLERAHAVAPPARRPHIALAVAFACDRLRLGDKAVEFLMRSIDAQPDPVARERLFDELLSRVHTPATLEVLRAKFAERHRRDPADWFASTALARLLKAAGEEDAAFTLLRDAALTAVDQPANLRTVVHEAEERGDWDAALALQRRLAFYAPDNESLAELERLATLQEQALEIDAASRTWHGLVTRAPRDARLLCAAAEFALRWDLRDDALRWLRATRAVDPSNIAALLHLAGVAPLPEALACVDELLRRTPPEPPAAPVVLPGATNTSTSPPAEPPAPGSPDPGGFESGPEVVLAADQTQRLEAIRIISERLRAARDARTLQTWLARWHPGTGCNEPLWAFFFSHAGPQTLDHIERLRAARPDETRLTNAFAWAALALGEMRRLGEWLAAPDRTPAEQAAFGSALGRFIAAHPSDARLATELFSPGFHPRPLLLQAARLCASHGAVRNAATLGQRTLGGTHRHPAGAAIETAHWLVLLGATDQALEILRKLAAEPGASSTDDAYVALRALWLLTDGKGCPQPVATPPIPAALSRTLRAALAGDHTSACRALDDLFALRAAVAVSGDDLLNVPATTRFWSFVLTTGLRLQGWGFYDEARHFWRRALADKAAIHLSGADAQTVSAELHVRLLAQDLLETWPHHQPALLAACRAGRDLSQWTAVATLLENSGYLAEAAQVHAAILDADPQNTAAAGALLRAARRTPAAAFGLDRAIATITKAKDLAPAVRSELAAEAADVLVATAGLDAGVAFLEEILAQLPDATNLHLLLARRQLEAGNPVAAERACRHVLAGDARHNAALMLLAEALRAQGMPARAAETLAHCQMDGAPPAVVSDWLAAGNPARATAFATRAAADHPPTATQLVRVLADHGRVSDALRLAQACANRAPSDDTRFDLLAEALQHSAPGTPHRTWLLRRLGVLARAAPARMPQYCSLLRVFATDARRELAGLWRDGAGPLAAGMQLAQVLTEKQAPASAIAPVVHQVLAHPALRPPAARTFYEQLKTQPATVPLARLVGEQMADAVPGDDFFVLARVRDLHEAGRDAEVATALEALRPRTVFRPEFTRLLARAAVDCGAWEPATALYQQAMQNDPLARDNATWLEAADLHIRLHHLDTAEHILRRALRNAAVLDLGPLARLLAARAPAGPEPEAANGFALTTTQRRALLRALFELRLQTTGFDNALELVRTHKAVLFLEPDFPRRLQEAALAADRAAAAARVLDEALAQKPAPVRELTAAAAALHAAAATRAEAGGDVNTAVAHLERATSLEPARLEPARALARLLAARGDPAGARAVLHRLQEASQNARDRQAAKEMLATF